MKPILRFLSLKIDAENDQLVSIDADGNKTIFAENLSGTLETVRFVDIAFGVDNALYLSDEENDRILRIAPSRETLGLKPSEHPSHEEWGFARYE